MDNDVAIRVDQVGKVFRLPHEKNTSIKSAVVNIGRRKKGYEKQQVLSDVSFSVQQGEFFGIVGRNGSGKSTLLKLLAGIYSPSRGTIEVHGKLTPFIELGVGFNPELTGRENVFLNGALLGFNRKEMRTMYEDIVKFAELKRFMDQKLKNYSSGMQVRLAFSIAIRAKSDILLIDEVLAVGDAAFQAKCFEYFRVLKKNGKTVIFVSHDRGAIETFCDRCILIEGGKLQLLDTPSKVLQAYNKITLEQIEEGEKTAKPATTTPKRVTPKGSHDIRITKGVVKKGDQRQSRFMPHDMITLEITMKANKAVDKPVYGIVVRRDGDEPVFVTNTKTDNIATKSLRAGQVTTISYELENIFGNGTYHVSPAVANNSASVFYDWREDFMVFHSSGWNDNFVAVHPPHHTKLNQGD